jgi:hypothetical protein
MKQLITGLLIASCFSSPLAVAGKKVNVEITNLTNAIYFTPLLVSAHDRNTHIFEPGTAASSHLQAMAEGGDISGLVIDLESVGANNVANPAGGLLAPGASTNAKLEVNRRNRSLSIVAMLLPTNDGFVGLDALPIPAYGKKHTYYLNAYDAGTEANDEVINGGDAPGTPGIPADPGGNSGTGASGVTTVEYNTTVHVHRGIVGGADSDLDKTVHRWNNPVAKIVITTGGGHDKKDWHY